MFHLILGLALAILALATPGVQVGLVSLAILNAGLGLFQVHGKK